MVMVEQKATYDSTYFNMFSFVVLFGLTIMFVKRELSDRMFIVVLLLKDKLWHENV